MFTQAEIISVTNAISRKFDARKIFLFGSYALGDPSSDSDLDLCVIADLRGKRKLDLIREIRRELGVKLDVPLDILLYSEDEFEKRASLKNTFEHKIQREGKVISG